MKEGYIILIVIALLFLSMYAFANFSVYMEKSKRRKAKKEELKKEALRLEELARKQELRDEKWRNMEERRQEMKEQMKRINEIKQEWENRGKSLI